MKEIIDKLDTIKITNFSSTKIEPHDNEKTSYRSGENILKAVESGRWLSHVLPARVKDRHK